MQRRSMLDQTTPKCKDQPHSGWWLDPDPKKRMKFPQNKPKKNVPSPLTRKATSLPLLTEQPKRRFSTHSLPARLSEPDTAEPQAKNPQKPEPEPQIIYPEERPSRWDLEVLMEIEHAEHQRIYGDEMEVFMER